jgi:hypothetical protein
MHDDRPEPIKRRVCMHPHHSHWCCDCGQYEMTVFDAAAGVAELRIKCKRCDGWMRLGTHEHDDRLEPADDTIAALQQEVVRQRSADPNVYGEHLSHRTSEGTLFSVALLLRVYEKLKAQGR